MPETRDAIMRRLTLDLLVADADAVAQDAAVERAREDWVRSGNDAYELLEALVDRTRPPVQASVQH